MELHTGFQLVYQQFFALFMKNILVCWRNKCATFTQLFSSFFFMFCLFSIDKALESNRRTATEFSPVRNPQAIWDFPIPPCESKFFFKTPCFDFIWSGNSTRIETIVKAIMANNPGRPIPAQKVKSFRTRDEAEAWLFSYSMHVPGALHFVDVNETVITYGLQNNFTQVLGGWHGQQEDITFKFQIPLQIAAEREIARSILQAPNLNWTVGLMEFAHPAKAPSFSAVSFLGPPFFLAAAMFGFVLQISTLVTEKELKLRQAMDMAGLYAAAYWTSWIIWEGIISLYSSLVLVVFGLMFQFDIFMKNNLVVVFLVFFLFQVNLIGFALMLSTFISKASSATTVGFSISIIGFLTQLFTSFGFPYKFKGIPSSFEFIWTLFPPNLLAIAVMMLSDASDSPEDLGISWKGRSKCPLDTPDDCVITINEVYVRLMCLFALWLALGTYFDCVLPNAYGVRKAVFYFLKPGYWTGKGGDKLEEGGIFSCAGEIPQHTGSDIPDDEDVLEEENIIRKDAREGTVKEGVVVQIRGLSKTFLGSTQIGCCKWKKSLPYHAVKGLWLNLKDDQIFCLLGPNGAGKTTTINCLTGLISATSGDALVDGYSVRSTVGMSKIRKIIGVCPQFDILWDALTGEEHLHLFAMIKGIPRSLIKLVSQEALERVDLTKWAKVKTRNYSGGIRRRLSVAIALLGNPKLVILDEPTTGMDIISRREVWDTIQELKKGRAVVLTTHSMDEADILGDRIGIITNGSLRCIGNSGELKAKYGTGFTASMSFDEMNGGNTRDNRTAVKNLFKSLLDVKPAEETESFLSFVIPDKRKDLVSKCFSKMEARKEKYGVLQLQFGLTTLEEVFLRIAKQAEGGKGC